MSDLETRLRERFRWAGDEQLSDIAAWWADAAILGELGAALADLHHDTNPTVVAGIEARGFVLGPLVAVHLGVGFVEVRKDVHPDDAGERLLRRTTAPDYNGRSLRLTIRPHLLRPSDRVLLIDDWLATGSQATAVSDLVADAEASWSGVACIIDALPADVRRRLKVRALLRETSLPWHRRRSTEVKPRAPLVREPNRR